MTVRAAAPEVTGRLNFGRRSPTRSPVVSRTATPPACGECELLRRERIELLGRAKAPCTACSALRRERDELYHAYAACLSECRAVQLSALALQQQDEQQQQQRRRDEKQAESAANQLEEMSTAEVVAWLRGSVHFAAVAALIGDKSDAVTSAPPVLSTAALAAPPAPAPAAGAGRRRLTTRLSLKERSSSVRGKTLIALHSFEPTSHDEMALVEGRRYVGERLIDNGGWWTGREVDFSDFGVFPASYVVVVGDSAAHAAAAAAADRGDDGGVVAVAAAAAAAAAEDRRRISGDDGGGGGADDDDDWRMLAELTGQESLSHLRDARVEGIELEIQSLRAAAAAAHITPPLSGGGDVERDESMEHLVAEVASLEVLVAETERRLEEQEHEQHGDGDDERTTSRWALDFDADVGEWLRSALGPEQERTQRLGAALRALK